MKRSIFSTLLYLFSLYEITVLSGCGQAMPPTGGPRDTLPPMLVLATPKDSSLSFKGSRITLQFDEYVQLDNPLEKIIVSPLPATSPQIQSKLRTVSIRLRDTLEPNTTYSINFGDALKDINESNPLRNFTYIFSTGDTIDNYALGGRVLLAETGKADSTLIVILHRNLDDSAVAKERPRYFTRMNGEGYFNFHYLAPGRYNVYALKDVDGGKKYDQQSEMIGFLDETVNISDTTQPVTIYAFAELPEDRKPLPGAGGATKTQDKRFRYTANLENNQQDILGNLEITFERPIKTFDTSKLLFTDEQFTPITDYRLTEDSTHQKLILEHNWKENTKYNLILQKDFAFDSLENSVTRTDTLNFTTKKETDYGSLRIRFTNADNSVRQVLLFFRNNNEYLVEPIANNELNYRLFRPGEYELRILFDRNNNGQWDTGNYWLKLQPEKVVARPGKLTIRPNFDNELGINLQELEN